VTLTRHPESSRQRLRYSESTLFSTRRFSLWGLAYQGMGGEWMRYGIEDLVGR
jgi:hypothetical protein